MEGVFLTPADAMEGVFLTPAELDKMSTSLPFSVQTKEPTRVAGPWKDEDFMEKPPMTKRLQKVVNCGLREWQTQVKDLISVYDDRTIIMIVDVEGNCDKSAFAEYMEYEGLAYEIPPMRLMEDIMACCMSIPTQTCYMVDLPIAMKKDKLSDFFSGLECLKNGVMYDKRYKFKKKRIDCPQVIVFSNKYPDKNYLSPDRWEMYNIVDNKLFSICGNVWRGEETRRGINDT